MISMSAMTKRESKIIQRSRWAINRGLSSIWLVVISGFGGGELSRCLGDSGTAALACCSEKNNLPGKHKRKNQCHLLPSSHLSLRAPNLDWLSCACLTSAAKAAPLTHFYLQVGIRNVHTQLLISHAPFLLSQPRVQLHGVKPNCLPFLNIH